MKTYIPTIAALALSATLACAEGNKEKKNHPPQDRPNPEEIFKKLDTDGSGSISLEEFQASPKGKENPERAAEFFKKLDANGDGQITKEEFAANRPNPEEIFKKLDTDGNGSISLEEFQASPKGKENPERAAELFKKLDANGDGQVTKEELAANRPNPEEIFKKLDTDGSGSISLEEFQASPKGKENPERAAEFFKKLDANGDGQVTKEEFAKHRPQHPPGNKAGPGDQGNGGGTAVE